VQCKIGCWRGVHKPHFSICACQRKQKEYKKYVPSYLDARSWNVNRFPYNWNQLFHASSSDRTAYDASHQRGSLESKRNDASLPDLGNSLMLPPIEKLWRTPSEAERNVGKIIDHVVGNEAEWPAATRLIAMLAMLDSLECSISTLPNVEIIISLGDWNCLGNLKFDAKLLRTNCLQWCPQYLTTKNKPFVGFEAELFRVSTSCERETNERVFIVRHEKLGS
jgi:hypothetical protein